MYKNFNLKSLMKKKIINKKREGEENLINFKNKLEYV